MIDESSTTVGAVEEDLIKCFEDYLLNPEGKEIDESEYEIQGNILIPRRLRRSSNFGLRPSLVNYTKSRTLNQK